VLVQHVLGCGHAVLAADPERVLSALQMQQVEACAERRLGHEPVARITGEKEFWGLSLRIGPAVLVPRPDTETLVEAALDQCPRDQAVRIADLGTGSGAILLALLTERPRATGVGIDISEAAAATARENAARHGLAQRAVFVVGDFTAPLGGELDLVVSNPPYIACAEIAGLAPEVRDYDPHAALDGGTDGLDFYRRLAAEAGRILGRGGHVAVEIGQGQAAAVESVFARFGFVPAASARADLSGTARALVFGRA
jgi:release factor glutamine methyltransferase